MAQTFQVTPDNIEEAEEMQRAARSRASELKATAESEGRAVLASEQRKYDKLIRRADDIEDALEDIRQQVREVIASRRAELDRFAPPKGI